MCWGPLLARVIRVCPNYDRSFSQRAGWVCYVQPMLVGLGGFSLSCMAVAIFSFNPRIVFDFVFLCSSPVPCLLRAILIRSPAQDWLVDDFTYVRYRPQQSHLNLFQGLVVVVSHFSIVKQYLSDTAEKYVLFPPFSDWENASRETPSVAAVGRGRPGFMRAYDAPPPSHEWQR